MTIDDMYHIRQLIDCAVCSNKDLNLCFKLLTAKERNQYAEKYGCICGCECSHCLDRRECDEHIN